LADSRRETGEAWRIPGKQPEKTLFFKIEKQRRKFKEGKVEREWRYNLSM
jgi:hypothetical protein